MLNITQLPIIYCKTKQFIRQMQASWINFEIRIVPTHYKKIWKRRSSNCSNLQAGRYMLNISKPAGLWWRTPFVGNSSWSTSIFFNLQYSQFYCQLATGGPAAFTLMSEDAEDLDPVLTNTQSDDDSGACVVKANAIAMAMVLVGALFWLNA